MYNLNMSGTNSTTVEFALPSLHETSSDSGIKLISGVIDLENKSRKRPRSLSILSVQ